MSDSPPSITEAQIRQLSSDQSFERGHKYYRQGAVFEPVRQGNELRAYCEGSSYEPYRVSVTLSEKGIEATHCTCPYDWGGLCKHRVALLLSWMHEPEAFDKIPPLDELLANRSKEELVGLIKEMLKREPDLTRLLELPVQPDRQTPLDVAAFRRQIAYALRQGDYGDYPDVTKTANELTAIVDTADRFREGKGWTSAGALYTLVLSEIVPKYPELYDEYGDVAVVLQSCAEGLEDCFAEGSPDPDARRAWLKALLEAELMNVRMGGIDLATPAGEVVINQATDEEWDWIEAKIRRAMEEIKSPYSDWSQEVLVGLLVRRLEAKGEEARADDLILEVGSPSQQAFLRIQQGQFDEAVAIANEHFSDLPGLVTQFANALVEAGAGQQAEAYIASQLNGRNQPSYLTWLAQNAEEQGELNVALDWWRQSLEQTPRFETYLAIRQVAQELGQWEPVRFELWQTLEAQEAWPVLIEIALDNEDVPRALELLSKLRGWHSRDYELRVAQAAEPNYPRIALDIYRHRVQALIDARGRDHYREAASLLTRIRNLYQQQNEKEDWQQYLARLRVDHKQLPALQDELNKAGL